MKRDVISGEVLQWFSGHLSVVRDLCFWEGVLFSASADGTARCWDTDTGGCLVTLSGHGCAVCSISSTPSCVFTGSSDGVVRKFKADPQKASRGWFDLAKIDMSRQRAPSK